MNPITTSQPSQAEATTFAGARWHRTSYTANGGGDTRFLYDGDNVLADFVEDGENPGSYIASRVYVTPFLDENLSMTVVSGEQAGTYYYSQDRRHSVVTLTDSNGAMKNCYDLTAMGERLPGTHESVVQRYEYTGRELASESSGYYFFRYRSYGPALGQFFTRDPLGYADGMGLYGGSFAWHLGTDPQGTLPLLFITPGPVAGLQCANKVKELMDTDQDIKSLLGLIKTNKKACPAPKPQCLCCSSTAIRGAWVIGEKEFGFFIPALFGKAPSIGLCFDRIKMPGYPRTGFDRLKEVLWHELIHWYDRCDEKDPEGRSGDEIICGELRAYSISGACDAGGGSWDPSVSRENCLAAAARGSVSGKGGCGGMDAEALLKRADALIKPCANSRVGDVIGRLLPERK